MICIYIYLSFGTILAGQLVRSEASWFLEQAWLKNDQRQAVGYAVVPRLKKNTGRVLLRSRFFEMFGEGLFFVGWKWDMGGD